ncbi:alkane 1-monooxygenase [Reichenbachiella ulvae]|uniref:Alkane 1-monooxygenase n=1 Tax=Reichenbachiella ulvae TaxID=2980104 RepID=A0ABT3CTS8_9BACT|nr:alkane 1-monooxygenase [Reichenbachiella ulvae]MCV9386944.1 alkane 1-monooxygenase [Reichenbachiella ulvae]
MNFRFLKYLSAFSIPLVAFFSMTSSGWWTWSALLYSYFMIPALEFFFPSDSRNLESAEEEVIKQDRIYDFLVYAIVPVQYGLLIYFLSRMSGSSFTTIENIGLISAMGISCGVLGINVGHELGHRVKKGERLLAKLLLLTSLYMHFYIEHNRGHHKNVSTPEDPSSARQGEPVYFFWVRSISMAYVSAWGLERNRLKSKGLPFFSLQNEMLIFQMIQLALVLAIYSFFGWWAMLAFLMAALIGILQLETVNYIEHYGLSRNKSDSGRYERVMPWHSWNSNHMLGRLMLFELSRHSDHHYLASRKYQILRHHEGSPQMPTGYPGMMLLSLVPPLWFWVMNPKVGAISAASTPS